MSSYETINKNVKVCDQMKEGNVLFNNAFNTFYLRLYDIRHMVVVEKAK